MSFTAFSQGPGPCPVCGAANSTCVGPSNVETRFQAQGRAQASKWFSKERVWEDDRLKYAVGHPIPLLEALRQGVATVADLTEDEKQSLVEHSKDDPKVQEVLQSLAKALRRPARDKMVRSADAAVKGV